jgi:hypothetical protein
MDSRLAAELRVGRMLQVLTVYVTQRSDDGDVTGRRILDLTFFGDVLDGTLPSIVPCCLELSDEARLSEILQSVTPGVAAVEEDLTARGLDRLEPLAGGPAVSATANHADGRWTLVLTRSLESDDELRPAFRTGEAIPIAFYAWDGSNGESGRRAAIGSWYFLFLEEPASAAVIVIPIAAVLITALLGLAAVRYAQSTRRQQERAPVAGAALLDS